MWPFRKKKNLLLEGTKPEVKPVAQMAPKPKTWTAVTKIVVVNNRTDKEYTYESRNCYGLSWQNFNGPSATLCIKQYEEETKEQGKWHWIAQFSDFSMVRVEKQEFSSDKPGKTENDESI